MNTINRFEEAWGDLDKFDQDELRLIIENFAETILEYV